MAEKFKLPKHIRIINLNGAGLIIDKNLNEALVVFSFPFFDEDDVNEIFKQCRLKFKGKIYAPSKMHEEDSGHPYLKKSMKLYKSLKTSEILD